jgi:uncharacterized iron-regulated membrane protein
MMASTTETLEPDSPTLPDTDRSAASRRWRSLFRIHFYAGMFAMPFILLMAFSGLVILYTQPIQNISQRNLRQVPASAEHVSYDVLSKSVETAYPGQALKSLTVPTGSGRSAVFAVDDGSAAGRQVFVNPHTGKVLGTLKTGGGIVGLANRMHGYLNNNAIRISLPSVGALWDHGKVMRPYVVGDLLLEMLGVWTLVLVMSGLYLWWPRRSTGSGTKRNGRGLLRVRLRKTGRARWRDLHGASGVLLFSIILLTVISGLAWSAYWGPNFTALANSVSPNVATEAPPSVLGKRGDLDRLGNQIPWNTASMPIPASYATTIDGTMPAALSLEAIVSIAEKEGMKPGYTVNFPANVTDEATQEITYGSFTVSNSWPRKTSEARDLFLDQFSGTTRAEQNAYGYGTVSNSLDTMVSLHMGTQLGLFSRLMMTALCLLSIWSVFSGFVMFWKRRRPGTLGVPRRPVEVRLARRVGVTAMVMAVLFPVWGVTAAAVMAFDRFVIRRTRPLTAAFGQR